MSSLNLLLTKYGVVSLTTFACAHFVVDLACAFLLFRLVGLGVISNENVLLYYIIYNLLAFGLEAFIGLFYNASNAHVCSCVGCALLALGLGVGAYLEELVSNVNSSLGSPNHDYTLIASYYANPGLLRVLSSGGLLACVLAGIGNAFFHVGGGIDALTVDVGKRWRSGVFISTGALGLALGTILGRDFSLPFWCIVLILAITVLLIWKLCRRENLVSIDNLTNKLDLLDEQSESHLATPFNKTFDWLVLGSALVVIFARSFIGFVAPESWTSRQGLTIAPLFLAYASFVGKFLGGFLADLWNARNVGVASLLLAIPTLCFCDNSLLFIFGVFLLNITTSITLVSVAQSCTGRAGFAFGLTTWGLLCGYLSYVFFDWNSCRCVIVIMTVILFVASVALFFSTWREKNNAN